MNLVQKNLVRKNLLLGGLCVVLAVPTILQLRSDAETFVDVGRIPLLFDGFTSDNVAQILLGKPKAEQPQPDPQRPGQPPRVAHDLLAFARTDKGWVIGAVPGSTAGDLAGAPVGKERVEADVLHHLRTIRADQETLVQPNASAAQLAEFGLDEANAFVIKAVDATGTIALAELWVGRDAGHGLVGTEAVRGVFVRKGDSNDVILYEQATPWRRDVEPKNWLERVLFRLEPDKVRRLSIRNAAIGSKPVVVERSAGRMSWQPVQVPEGVGALRQAEVEGLVQRLAYVAAQDYRLPLARAGNMQALGLFPPQIELQFTVADEAEQRTITIEVGNKVDGANEYYLTCSESSFLMTWPVGSVLPFELDVKAQWFDPAPPEPPKGEPPKDGGR